MIYMRKGVRTQRLCVIIITVDINEELALSILSTPEKETRYLHLTT